MREMQQQEKRNAPLAQMLQTQLVSAVMVLTLCGSLCVHFTCISRAMSMQLRWMCHFLLLACIAQLRGADPRHSAESAAVDGDATSYWAAKSNVGIPRRLVLTKRNGNLRRIPVASLLQAFGLQAAQVGQRSTSFSLWAAI